MDAYSIDSQNGLPIATTATPFITGLTGAEGALIDPVTGDFLFSSFGGGNQIVEVQGFAVPPSPTPEPATIFLMAAGLMSIVGLGRRTVRSYLHGRFRRYQRPASARPAISAKLRSGGAPDATV